MELFRGVNLMRNLHDGDGTTEVGVPFSIPALQREREQSADSVWAGGEESSLSRRFHIWFTPQSSSIRGSAENIRIHFLSNTKNVRIGKRQNRKMSESELVRIGKCQNPSKPENVRIWKCQSLNLSELENVRIWTCQNLNLSESENVRIL